MSRVERRAMVERAAPMLSVSQQCRLLAVSRCSVYRRPPGVSEQDRTIMALIDRQYLTRPYYGSRRMAAWLATQGHLVNRKRVQRLMGLVAIYQRPNTSRPAPENKVYPYLLGGLSIERVNQVWCADITYIPMARGFLYLVVIMDWVSRAVLAWRLSNTLGADFCVEALEEALAQYGKPEIFNTDQSLPSRKRGVASSPAASSPVCSSTAGSRSAWMARACPREGGGSLHGQHLRRAAVAQPEIRGGLSPRLWGGGRGEGRHRRLAQLLQPRFITPIYLCH
jgi:hypothetical protein